MHLSRFLTFTICNDWNTPRLRLSHTNRTCQENRTSLLNNVTLPGCRSSYLSEKDAICEVQSNKRSSGTQSNAINLHVSDNINHRKRRVPVEVGLYCRAVMQCLVYSTLLNCLSESTSQEAQRKSKPKLLDKKSIVLCFVLFFPVMLNLFSSSRQLYCFSPPVFSIGPAD